MSGGTASVLRRPWLARLAFVAACTVAVGTLAIGVPFAQEAERARQCAEQGGRLERSTEDLEPLATGRTVFTCYSPSGQVIARW